MRLRVLKPYVLPRRPFYANSLVGNFRGKVASRDGTMIFTVQKLLLSWLGISLDQLPVISTLHGSVDIEEGNGPHNQRGYASKGNLSSWFLEYPPAVSRVTPLHTSRTLNKAPAPTSALCFETYLSAEDDLIPCPSWFPHVGRDPSQSVQLVLFSEVRLQSSNPGRSIKIVEQNPPHSPGVNVCEGPRFSTNLFLDNYFSEMDVPI